MKKLVLLGLIVFLIGFIWQTQAMQTGGPYVWVTPEESTISYGETETFTGNAAFENPPGWWVWSVDGTLVASYADSNFYSSYTTEPLAVGVHTIECGVFLDPANAYYGTAVLTVQSSGPSPTPTSSPYPTPTPSPAPTPTPQPTPSPNPDPKKVNVIVNPSSGGSTVPDVGFYEYVVGQSLTFTATPDEGYHFLRWELSDSSIKLANPYVTTASVGFSIKAVLEADLPPDPETNTLLISVTAGGTTEPAPGSYDVTIGETRVVTAKPDSGYLFDYWLFNNGSKVRVNPVLIFMDEAYSVRGAFYKFVAAPNVDGSNAEDYESPFVPSKIVLPGGGVLDVPVVVMAGGGVAAGVGVFMEFLRRKSQRQGARR